MHYTALQCTTLQRTTVHYTAQHYNALHCTALHCTTPHHTALHCTTLIYFSIMETGRIYCAVRKYKCRLNYCYAVAWFRQLVASLSPWRHAVTWFRQLVTSLSPWRHAVTRFRQLVACLSPWRPGYGHWPFRVGFMVDRAEVGQVYPRLLRVSLMNIAFSFVLSLLRRASETWEPSKKAVLFLT